MVLSRIFSHVVVFLFAITLVAGQNTKSSAGPDNSTPNRSKPSAGIPQTKAEPRKRDDPADRQLAQQIRRAMTKDKSLSTFAHNVTIICQNGMVTLRGPVRSEDEKQSVEGKAIEVVGSNHVTSELAVAPRN
jgi:hyperosmotically inducible periplasmic protein